ncbi:hypothetical protein C4573_04205 [Candidatus Woesearchaeota archaeon]|nr:MAG: hypothetical protein C4573_04205 [Candidatus Woesearchaeota archaeon]
MEHLLLGHYRKENDAYCVDIAADSLDELFAKHDPSPLHQRDLNPRIASELAEQIVFFPHRHKVKTVLHMNKKLQKHEQDIRTAFHHHFEFEYLDNQLHLDRRVIKARRILLFAFFIFISLIALSFLIQHYFPDSVFWHIVSESLFVGSWVTLWHPIHLLLYEWIPLHENKKNFKRLMEMELQFVYA